MDNNRIIIFDTTLRDGEQSPGCSMNLEEKLRVAHALEELGVDGGFLVAGETLGGFALGPAEHDGVGAVLRGAGEMGELGGFLKKARDEEGALAAQPNVLGAVLGFVESGSL